MSNDSVSEIEFVSTGSVDEFRVEIGFRFGKPTLGMDRDAGKVRLLKRVCGYRVKLPSGYSISGLSSG